MPSTRSCRDLSLTETQKKIDFPCRKTRSSTGTALKNTETIRQQPQKERSKSTTTGTGRKRVAFKNDENSSPCKSPRKEIMSPCKSPLFDRSNLPTTEDHIPRCESKLPLTKRKLDLDGKKETLTTLRQALHTSIPKVLISREREQTFIRSFMKKTMVELQPASMYMSGAPGTGKTACLMKALEELECSSCKKFQSVFINCMSIKSSQNIFIKIANEFNGCNAKPLTSKDSLKYLEKKFTTSGPRILLVLDEIDQLESKNQEVLYKLFEIPFLQKSRLVLIGIANALDLTDRILPRLQSKASCKPLLLQFSPYNKEEICSILNARINEIGSGFIDPSAVQFCARKVCAVTGDVRKALDILRRAVEINESNLKKMSKSSDKLDNATAGKKVTISHVASVCSEVYGSRLSTSSGTILFPLQQKLVICTLMVCLKDKKVKEVTTGKLYESYSRVCKSRQVKGVAQEEFSSVCSLLESQGIIALKKAKDSRNDKITLRLQESEVEHALQDKTLVSSILITGIPSS